MKPDIDYMISVMEAAKGGEKIERTGKVHEEWCQMPPWAGHDWSFNWDAYDYRVAPKPDTIDWSHVASEHKWMARDESGSVYLYQEPPKAKGSQWVSAGYWIRAVAFASYRRGTCDWKDSLVKRPE